MAMITRPFAPQPPPQAHGSAAPAPLRRCTFRRVAMKAAAGPRQLPVYDVACTFPDRRRAVPLGDIESARPICESCTYQGIFRPDSD
jgi:hypothetical protein